jgi:NAD(P)-dependent dehydrogenase (short-subunit alcohol dehydrogenase family)
MNMTAALIVITGANSGIGKATALALAKKGNRIVMVCRSEARGLAAQEEIISESGNQEVYLELCDLASHASVKACSLVMHQKYKAIDVLINNAGGIFGAHELTEDGLEKTFGLNHMGYFLFTHYMLDLVKLGNEKRIISVSSIAHKMAASIPWGDLQLRNIKYRQFQAYGLSKLYNIYFTKILAQKMLDEKTGITVNCLHPGSIYTGFGASGSKAFAKLVQVGGRFLPKPKTGAKTSVYLATATEVAAITGAYYAHGRKAGISRLAKKNEAAQRIWEKSMELANIESYGTI